jgi:hypothetical protein
MEINETVKFAGLIIGGPVYLYFVVRWMTSAIVRSYFETKFEMITKQGGSK